MIRGSGLSVTQFLRGSPPITYALDFYLLLSKYQFLVLILDNLYRIDEFIYHMRDFVDTVKLDQAVVTDCQYIIREFALSFTVFTKFEEIWNKLGIKDK